jgi:SAM-dependent methyltransferase
MVETELTEEVLSGFNDKASREDRFLRLYRENEYLTAYARHTDIRVADDPIWAIGRGDEWESHGLEQLSFLIDNGMRPKSRVLDLGCGVGRAARKIVPYLE